MHQTNHVKDKIKEELKNLGIKDYRLHYSTEIQRIRIFFRSEKDMQLYKLTKLDYVVDGMKVPIDCKIMYVGSDVYE